MVLVLTSSKGISLVVMARLLDVSQKTAWKMGHAIRELMADRGGEYLPLSGEVEVDEAYIGGGPKSLAREPAPRGRGTSKPLVLVAASRNGQARASVMPNGRGATLGPEIAEWVDPQDTHLMTDGNPVYEQIGQGMEGHSAVIHSQGEYANPITGAHANTAEAVISNIRWALVGAYHNSLWRGPDQDAHPPDADPGGRADAGAASMRGRATGAAIGVLRVAVAVGGASPRARPPSSLGHVRKARCQPSHHPDAAP